MPHLKCETCRIRVNGPIAGVGAQCPGCRYPLQPVEQLSDLVGFQMAGSLAFDVHDGPRPNIAAAVAMPRPPAD